MGILNFILLGMFAMCTFHVFLNTARNATRLQQVVDFPCNNFLNLQPVGNNQLAESLLTSRNKLADNKLLQAMCTQPDIGLVIKLVAGYQ